MVRWFGASFPFLTMQNLNLDWIMEKLKEILSFMPSDGETGDILVRNPDGAAWHVPESVAIDINGLDASPTIGDNDYIAFFDSTSGTDKKVKASVVKAATLSNDNPVMDGIAAPGISEQGSRSDHVHPSDTSKQDALTPAQLAAVNSGITSEKVADYDAKQDALTPTQLAAVNSGITAGKLADLEDKQDPLTPAQMATVNSGLTSSDKAAISELSVDSYAQINVDTSQNTGTLIRQICGNICLFSLYDMELKSVSVGSYHSIAQIANTAKAFSCAPLYCRTTSNQRVVGSIQIEKDSNLIYIYVDEAVTAVYGTLVFAVN